MVIHEWMLYLRTRPDREVEQAELGLREQDTIFDWHASYRNYQTCSQIAQFVSGIAGQRAPQPIQLDIPNVVFSEQQ